MPSPDKAGASAAAATVRFGHDIGRAFRHWLFGCRVGLGWGELGFGQQ